MMKRNRRKVEQVDVLGWKSREREAGEECKEEVTLDTSR